MEEAPLIPVRMLVQYAYCRRLFFLEWVDGEFRHNRYTIEGAHSHRSVASSHEKNLLEDETEKTISVELSSEEEGITGKVDYIEYYGGLRFPVEVKRGSLPKEGPWQDHKIQITAYAMLLRECGCSVDHGILYYAGSRKRVCIQITDNLVQKVRNLVAEAQKTAVQGVPPAPLKDSRKCEKCSLANICLPDEYWSEKDCVAAKRRVIPARDDGIPLYVQDQGARISRMDERLIVCLGLRKTAEVLLHETSQVCVMGNVQISTQAIHACMAAQIPIMYFSSGGYFKGMTNPLSTRSSRVRIQQTTALENAATKGMISSAIVKAKIKNQRTFLKRNAKDLDSRVVRDMAALARRVEKEQDPEKLLGLEGAAAALYFSNFKKMIKSDYRIPFYFMTRNRRPPKDPVNAMLSYAYGILAKDCTVVLQAVGFEPTLGFYHSLRPGKPALSLDLMEVFRPIVADSAVIYTINNGMVTLKDFHQGKFSVAMKPESRIALIKAYERRMEQLVTHPVYDYRVSYRRIIEIEARSLARFIGGETDKMVFFTTR